MGYTTYAEHTTFIWKNIMANEVDEKKLTDIIENARRVTGRIMVLIPRGYGFISSSEVPFTRIFFHWSGLTPSSKHFSKLRVGDYVEFELIEHEEKGLKAIKIDVKDRPNDVSGKV